VEELGVNQQYPQDQDKVTYHLLLLHKDLIQEIALEQVAVALVKLGKMVTQEMEVTVYKMILQDQIHITQVVEQVPEITQ
jgi:hypothetical protein